VGRSGDDIVGQTAPESCNSAEVDLPRSQNSATQHEPVSLVVNRRSKLLPAGEVRVVWILLGDVRIDVIQSMGPGVTGKHLEPLAEAATQIDVQCVVVGKSIVHIGLNYRVGRNRNGGGFSLVTRTVAGEPILSIKRFPKRPRAIRCLGGAS